MFAKSNSPHAPWLRLAMFVFTGLAAAACLWSLPARQSAQAQAPPAGEVAGPSGEAAPTGDPNATPAPTRPKDTSINLWELTIAGGFFMIPIFAMSILSVTMAIERFLGL